MQTEAAPPKTPAESSAGEDDLALLEALAEATAQIRAEVAKVVVGHDEVVDLLLTTLFARGHGLFVGVPGLAKTLLIRTLTGALDLDFKRVQFTPDLMPSDILGTEVLDEDRATGTRSFRFVPGPVFTNVLLADEINRTPPRTQAALLQCMAEGEVSVGGVTRPLPPPYAVFATQNPIEQEGTYPLPEAQLDRFLMQIDVGYPTAEEEREIVRRTTSGDLPSPEVVLSAERLRALQALVPRVPVADHVLDYAVDLVRATRPGEASAPAEISRALSYGAGPRASQSLITAAKARAAMRGAFSVEREDIDALLAPVLRHRLVLSFRGRAEGTSIDALLEAVKAAVRG